MQKHSISINVVYGYIMPAWLVCQGCEAHSKNMVLASTRDLSSGT
jgi:hypothetical protein